MSEKQSPMPDFYVPPLQLPLYWGDEQSGTLPNAVKAFFAHMEDPDKPFQGVQFALVRDYLRYYINAPCWKDGGDGKIEALRVTVQGLKTPTDVFGWIARCLDLGIDPL